MVSKAIILVAGMGSRLKPLTDKQPKCLTEVNGKAILKNALEILAQNRVAETTLVVGYLDDAVREAIGASYKDMPISYVENADYAKTNTAYSLLLGMNYLNGFDQLFILEGDVFFEERLFAELMKDSNPNLTALEKYNPSLDGTFAEVDSEWNVVDWVHKKNRTPDYVVETKHKTVNIHKFSQEFADRKLKPALAEQVERFQGNVPLEDVMRLIVTWDHHLVKGFDTGTYKWFEIDDMNDLKIAEKIFI